jgi:hypothetical protein
MRHRTFRQRVASILPNNSPRRVPKRTNVINATDATAAGESRHQPSARLTLLTKDVNFSARDGSTGDGICQHQPCGWIRF